MPFSEFFCHMIWKIAPESKTLNTPTRLLVERFLISAGDMLGYSPLAVAVLDDHVHLFAQLQPGIAPGQLIEDLKGRIIKYIGEQLASTAVPEWSEGYGVVSVSRVHSELVIEYVKNQVQRHREGRINRTLERVEP